jgi:hypothetical protein
LQFKESMKISKFKLFIWLIIFLISRSVLAQNSEPTGYHPFLSDRFNLGIGGFWPDKSFEIRVDGSDPGEDIDFEKELRHDESESTPSINFRWRYSKNWSLWGQYWALDSQGGTILTEDLEWGDTVFEEGTFVNAGIETSIFRVFFGRSYLNDSPWHEFGLGAGFHWLDIESFIEAQAITTTTYQRESVSAAFPLPNIGAWYQYSWSPKWVTEVSSDWLSASIGDYKGGLLNTQIGVNYQMSDIFGVTLSYNYFIFDIDVNKSDWRGQIETRQQGLRLALTASW